MKITKLDAARRQLETAIVLYFHEADPVSIHTLSAAAYEVLWQLSKAGGAKAMIKDWMVDYIKPDHLREVRRALNASQNFFKHAGKDPDAVLEFEPGQADYLMLDGCWAYRRLAGERLPLFGVFESWAAATWARDAVTYPGMETLAAGTIERLSALSRQAFFDEMLPVAFAVLVNRPQH